MDQVEEYRKAQDLLKHKKVFRLRDKSIELNDHYLVKGSEEEDYLVILPQFCTCYHFHINCIKTPGKICKHILAAKISSPSLEEKEVDNWQNLLFDRF